MHNWVVLIVLVSILELGFARPMEARTSLPQRAGATDADIATTVKALRQIKTDSFDTTVPVAAKPLLTTLKHQLRDLISKTLDLRGSQLENLDSVQMVLVRKLRKQGITLEQPGETVVGEDCVDTGYTYGDIYKVNLERLPRHPDLIAATTTIGICCGQDTSFYVFRRIARHWELIIAQEANNYDEVSGAQGSFRYDVSPPSANGQFFLVTANVNPWCISNWQSIRYQVFREGESPYQPKILLQRAETVYLGSEEDGTISILPDGFRIEFDGGQALDAAVLVRKHIVAYRVEVDLVSRVPPLAAEPEGFLDEWLQLPWEEAAKWTELPELANVREWHQRLRAARSTKDVYLFTNFIFDPPACKVEKGVWQIGLEFSPYSEGGSLPFGMPEGIYFTVVQQDDAYVLRSVSPILIVSHCNPQRTSGQ